MNDTKTYLCALLEGRRYALPMEAVESVLTDAAVFPVPLAPAGVCGVLRYGEEIVAVLDPFGLRAAPAALQVLCRLNGRLTAYTAELVEDDTGDREGETLFLDAGPI